MDNVVTWSFENVVTIFLMVLLGWLVLSYGMKLLPPQRVSVDVKIINTKLAGNPVNWIKVNVMALTAFFGLYLIFSLFNRSSEED